MPTAYQNPLEASQGLTSAFNPTTTQQKQSIAYAASLVPTKKTTEPTVLGSTNIDQKNRENTNKINSMLPPGQVVGPDGIARNADQTFAEAGSDATPQIGENGLPTGMYSSGGINYALGPSNGKISSDPNVQRIHDQFTSLKSEMDATGAALIENIKNQFAGLVKQQEQANRSSNAGVFSLLQRGGSLQTGSSEGIIQSQVSYGLQQIADLNTKEQGAIIAAKQAMQNNDYKILDKQLTIAQEAGKAKQEAAQKMSDSIIKARETQTKQLQQASRDSAIGGLMEQGITDPNQMLNYLNYDDEGNMIGDFTADEIAKTLKNLSKEVGIGLDKLTGETKNYSILKDIPGMLPTTITSLGQYLKWNHDLTTSKTASEVGNGAPTTSDQFSREQIALSVIPTQLRNSDTELKRYLEGIRLGLKEGKTPYQIADELMGYKINNPTPFSDSMRQYIAVANLSGPEIGNVARLLNSGNEAGAIAVVENKVLQTQKQNDPEAFVGEATPRYYSEKVAQIKKTIEDAGLMDAIGPLEGTAATVFGKLPFGQRREAAKIQAQITNLVAEMRNHLSGTAVTESEKKFLEPLVASLSDKKGIFINKLDEISSNSLTRYNQTRASGGLPELNEAQLLDKSKRVSLYGSGVSQNNSIDNEETAKSTIIEYGKTNPQKQAEIKNLMASDEYTFEDIKQILGI